MRRLRAGMPQHHVFELIRDQVEEGIGVDAEWRCIRRDHAAYLGPQGQALDGAGLERGNDVGRRVQPSRDFVDGQPRMLAHLREMAGETGKGS